MDAGAVVAALCRAAEHAGVMVDAAALQRLQQYIDTLLVWRVRTSLTTASTATAVIEQHIADSLAVVPKLPESARMVDIGSGAGFPGLVFAMVRPDVEVTLVESRRKRCSFLREVIRQTGLNNARVLEGRVESLAGELVMTMDVAIARALGTVQELVELSRPLLRPGGLVIAMKGPRGREEAMESNGFEGPWTSTYQLGCHGERHLILYRKRNG